MPKRKSIALPRKRKRPTDAPQGTATTSRPPKRRRSSPPQDAPRDAPRGAQRNTVPSSPSPSSSASPSGASHATPPSDDDAAAAAAAASSPGSAASADELTHRRPFAIMTARTRAVPESTVRRKWQALPAPAQERVLALVTSLQRGALAPQNDGARGGARGRASGRSSGKERDRREAQAAVEALTRQIGRRLGRMVFPRGTVEVDFDEEGVLRTSRDLESGLHTIRHAVTLLQAEIEREEVLLQQDEEELAELERNAKSEAGERRRALAKRSNLLPPPPGTPPRDGPMEIGLVDAEKLEEGGVDVDLDGELEPSLAALVRQLDSHLSSLEGNAAQTRGVDACVLHAVEKVDKLVRVRIGEDKAEELRALL